MKKKGYIFTIIFLLTAFLFGCTKRNTISEHAQEDMSILNSGNTQEVNVLIWESDIIGNYSSSSSFEAHDTESSSIIDTIMQKSQVEYVSEKNKKVTLKVTAPDLNNFFKDIVDAASDIENDDELADYMREYIEQAELITQEVEIDILEENGEIRFNYTDPVFINAFTGGLFDGYTDVRNSLLGQ